MMWRGEKTEFVEEEKNSLEVVQRTCCLDSWRVVVVPIMQRGRSRAMGLNSRGEGE